MLRTRLLVLRKAAQNTLAVRHGQEGRLIGKVMDHPNRQDANDDGSQTLKDENPRPAWPATNSIHLSNGSSEKTSERTSERSRREKDGHAYTEFGSLVPAGEEVADAWEETGLGESEKPSDLLIVKIISDDNRGRSLVNKRVVGRHALPSIQTSYAQHPSTSYICPRFH
jgi:hypothetical protein